jgi:Flp pilus assembly protein TadG
MCCLGRTTDTSLGQSRHKGTIKESGRLERPQAESPRRFRGDAGTALVEMAFIITPLCMLLFGIVIYGYLMSFRQNMTQAATEGARAGAVVPPDAGSTPATYNDARTAALDATNQSLQSFGKQCGSDGYGCAADVNWCVNNGVPSATKKCITVTVTYDYANHPLMPPVPIVTNFIPGTFTSTFSAQVTQ